MTRSQPSGQYALVALPGRTDSVACWGWRRGDGESDGWCGAARDIWLFAQCSDEDLDALVTLAVGADYPAGATLAREGDPERGFFVIVSGAAEARRGGTLLATLEPGDFFGEMAILERDVQVATVTTAAPTRVLAMTGVSFETMTETMPSIAARMLLALARRIRALEDRYLPLAEQVRRAPMLPAAD